MFKRAIVRPPSTNFSEGLTSANLGLPDHARAIEQHEAYCAALECCGLTLTRLEPDPRHPDSTFVEDAAVMIRPLDGDPDSAGCGILTRPGAQSRMGEVESLRGVLGQIYSETRAIREPGTLDGGDVCETENHFFIGISARTNEAGARQFAELVAPLDYTASFVDVRGLKGVLHLKSDLAYIGDNRLVLTEALAQRDEFRGYDLVCVDAGEEYAANCLCINQRVLVAAGHPGLETKLLDLGCEVISLEMSEFEKMDGGLSCLSLRF